MATARTIGMIARAMIWLTLIACVMTIMGRWVFTDVSTVFQQCGIAAQTAAMLIAAYITARAFAFIVREIENGVVSFTDAK